MSKKTDSELLAQYQFASIQYQDLLQVRHSILETLKKKPKDINLTINLRKVEGDIQKLTPIIQGSGMVLIDRLEDEFGIEFEFIKQKKKENKSDNNLKVSK